MLVHLQLQHVGLMRVTEWAYDKQSQSYSLSTVIVSKTSYVNHGTLRKRFYLFIYC